VSFERCITIDRNSGTAGDIILEPRQLDDDASQHRIRKGTLRRFAGIFRIGFK